MAVQDSRSDVQEAVIPEVESRHLDETADLLLGNSRVFIHGNVDHVWVKGDFAVPAQNLFVFFQLP